MNGAYLTRMLILTALLAVISLVFQLTGYAQLPVYNWFGLIYLLGVTVLIHAFIEAARDRANALIRRLMIGSILRMFLGILFLAVTLYNIKPVNLHFVLFYCVYFCVFMVFEISQMRTNLRPDLKPRPKNGNA